MKDFPVDRLNVRPLCVLAPRRGHFAAPGVGIVIRRLDSEFASKFLSRESAEQISAGLRRGVATTPSMWQVNLRSPQAGAATAMGGWRGRPRPCPSIRLGSVTGWSALVTIPIRDRIERGEGGGDLAGRPTMKEGAADEVARRTARARLRVLTVRHHRLMSGGLLARQRRSFPMSRS